MGKRRFQRKMDGYGLTAERDGYGYFHLIGNAGTKYEYDAGLVADAENFETAVDTAAEEMRVMVADAMIEFGG